jgi:HK97 gp10 family phage protein
VADKITVDIHVKAGGRIIKGTHAVNALVQQIEKARVDRRACARHVVNKYMLLMQGEARKQLKVWPERWDEGTLARSIQTMITSRLAAAVAAEVYTELEYSVFVHWGTGAFGENPDGGHRETPWVYWDEKRRRFVWTEGMDANPFLENAFNKYQRIFLAELRKCLSVH